MHREQLPTDFATRMRLQLGSEADDFFHALEQSPPVSIRLNPFKQIENSERRTANEMQSFSILHSPLSIDKVPWCDDAYYLSERPVFTYDPLFHAGCYYVQEASSMFAGEVAGKLLREEKNPLVLDAAAAPGGKSTHLLSALNERGLLVSNEIISQRNAVLQQNIWKWGLSNQVIAQQQLTEFEDDLFDLILLDAPCSGEGLFRRDGSACDQWSVAAVNGCSLRQRQLIDDVLPSLKVGGYLIYSTCTYAEAENDDTIAHAIETQPLEKISVDVPNGVVQTKHGFQFYPHRVKGEGFYISVLRKTLDIRSQKPDRTARRNMRRNNSSNIALADSEIATGDFSLNDQFTGRVKNVVSALPLSSKPLLPALSAMNLRSIGTPLYEVVKSRNVPHPALVLHHHYQPRQFIELDYDTALQYLYGESLQNESEVQNGYAVVQFQNHNLGWVKAAGTRLNNLYPHAWRVRKRKNA